MLRNTLFLMSLCITHACFSMDYHEMQSTSAQHEEEILQQPQRIINFQFLKELAESEECLADFKNNDIRQTQEKIEILTKQFNQETDPNRKKKLKGLIAFYETEREKQVEIAQDIDDIKSAFKPMLNDLENDNQLLLNIIKDNRKDYREN